MMGSFHWMSLGGIIIKPPAYKVFKVGSGNQTIKWAVDMNENRQPMGECQSRQEGLNLLFPQGADWSTSLSPLVHSYHHCSAKLNQHIHKRSPLFFYKSKFTLWCHRITKNKQTNKIIHITIVAMSSRISRYWKWRDGWINNVFRIESQNHHW